jgi:transcription antitermination factor NusG
VNASCHTRISTERFNSKDLRKTRVPSKDGEALSQMNGVTAYAEGSGVLASSDHLQPQWFAAYTMPRHEKRVHDLLTERGIENLLPLYRANRQWKKSAAGVLDLPLFPTYVFVRIALAERVSVLSMPGVVSLVGAPGSPWPLPDSEMEALRLGVQTRKLAPQEYLRTGQRVRVKAGLMAGVEGILVSNNNQYRIVLTIHAIMRSVAVEVDVADVEAIH